MYTVYEVDVIEELPQRQSGCILENDSIVVTVEEDKIKLTNWSDLQGQGLDSVDWLKKGEVDIIRCGKCPDTTTYLSFTNKHSTPPQPQIVLSHPLLSVHMIYIRSYVFSGCVVITIIIISVGFLGTGAHLSINIILVGKRFAAVLQAPYMFAHT